MKTIDSEYGADDPNSVFVTPRKEQPDNNIDIDNLFQGNLTP
jgi:hypothetical protein